MHIKKVNVINQQGNVNQNHELPHDIQDGYNKKKLKLSSGGRNVKWYTAVLDNSPAIQEVKHSVST